MKGVLSEHCINQKAKPIQKHTHTKVSSYERRTVQKFMATEMKEELLRKMHEITIVNLFMSILNI